MTGEHPNAASIITELAWILVGGKIHLFFEVTNDEEPCYMMYGQWYTRSIMPQHGTACDSLRLATRVIDGKTVPWNFCLSVLDINHAAHIVPRYPDSIVEYPAGDWKKVLQEGRVTTWRVNKWAFLKWDSKDPI